jgi:uncharacterized phage protein gp47/JayE
VAYFSPYIDETGIHIPNYIDLRDQLIEEMKQIFGQDIYIENDSADYQMISILAKKIFDSYSMGMLAYNNRTPNTAIGTGLDNNVAFADIQRKSSTYSSVQLMITGANGTSLKGCYALDENDNRWNIPDTVIPETGMITVDAICSVSGNISALPNTVNKIGTPLFGWYSVNNNNAATPGTDVETDAELRGRFSLAIRSPSLTVFESLSAAISALEGVSRISGFENDTSAESTGTEPPNIPAGLPPHSVTFIVEGGEDDQVAKAIYSKKTPGCYTNGTTAVQIVSEMGNIITIRFYRPTYVEVFAQIKVTKLPYWNDRYSDEIKNAIYDYIKGLEISDNVYNSMIWFVANSVMSDFANPAFVIKEVLLGKEEGSLTNSDVVVNFNEAAETSVSNITVVFE